MVSLDVVIVIMVKENKYNIIIGNYYSTNTLTDLQIDIINTITQ